MVADVDVERAPTRVLVICVGNEYRHDDGAGPAVARLLREQKDLPIHVLEETGEGSALIEAWQGESAVIVVDAIYSGADAGTIFYIDVHGQPVPSSIFLHSTHAFGVAEAIELSRTLDRLPPRLVVYGIEGGDFSQGPGLSPEVGEAAGHVATAVAAYARSLMPQPEALTNT